MTRALRRRFTQINQGPGSWLIVLLLLAVLVPSGCLVWFMSRAVQNERAATRLTLTEAYRGYLALAQEHLADAWRDRATALDVGLDTVPPQQLFAAHVRNGPADAVIVLGDDDRVRYPEPALPPEPPVPSPDWAAAVGLERTDPAAAADAYATLAAQTTNVNRAARALQGQLRCLVRAGETASAIALVTGTLAQERFRAATDPQGRLIVPNARIAALDYLDPHSPAAETLRQTLQQTLADYEGTPMPAPQRRLLTRQLLRLFPTMTLPPTAAAEDLAATVAEAGLNPPLEPGVSPGPVTNTWCTPSASGRVIALFTTETLLETAREAVRAAPVPDGASLRIEPPDGHEPDDDAMTLPAGPAFPGWQLALSLENPRFAEAITQQRIAGYIWTGALALAVVIVLALLALGMVRRQAALSRLRNDLVANVTHELKTPLASMRLLVDTLLDSHPLNEQTTREYLDLIAAENLRLSRLIDNFLTFSRIQRNKYQFDFQDVPSGTIAQRAADAVRERFDTPDCTFETDIAPELPELVADPEAMVTALVNLLDNAWKYSGPVRHIRLTAAAGNGAVRFRVSDNGIGLTPKETRRIFNRFYRVEPRGSGSGGGCGLGLSIVKFVVAAHHGTVHVESQPNRGSTFVVSIPAKQPSSRQGGPP